MELHQRVQKLEEAQDKMREASQLISDAVSGHGISGSANAYVVAHLDILIDSNHGYLDGSDNVEKLIESIQSNEEDEQ